MTKEFFPVLAILGGTAGLGTGLARCRAQAGYKVIIGSRRQEKADAAEALTSVLIVINKQYSCHAGIRITGLDGVR